MIGFSISFCYSYLHERSDLMAHINLRVDDEVKKSVEQALDEIGLSMSAAINVFLKKVAREKRMPFELSADPFYSESNLAHIQRGIDALNAGKGVEHELIEVDE